MGAGNKTSIVGDYIGQVKEAKALGLAGGQLRVWLACSVCNKPRWTSYREPRARCFRCVSQIAEGRVFSDETKRRMSEAKKGRIFSPEHCEKISKALQGHYVASMTKEHISRAQINRYTNELERIKTSKAVKKYFENSRNNHSQMELTEITR